VIGTNHPEVMPMTSTPVVAAGKYLHADSSPAK
jgi:hypothetical protein